jgi:cytidylate kinase
MALITITQNFGGDGMAIARKVAEEFGVEMFDDSKLQKLVQASGIPYSEISHFDKKAPGFLDQIMGHQPKVFLDILESVIYEVARKGEGVIIGHGSQVLLRNFNFAFHVRVFSSDNKRIDNLTAQMGLSRDAAIKLVRKRDHEQSGFFNFAFHLDRDDPSLYDLIIHTEKLDINIASSLIIQAARSESIRSCSPKMLDVLDQLALEKKVHAALLKIGVNMSGIVLEVPAKGTVHVYGITVDPQETQNIVSTVKGVPGVSNVVSRLTVVSGE